MDNNQIKVLKAFKATAIMFGRVLSDLPISLFFKSLVDFFGVVEHSIQSPGASTHFRTHSQAPALPLSNQMIFIVVLFTIH